MIISPSAPNNDIESSRYSYYRDVYDQTIMTWTLYESIFGKFVDDGQPSTRTPFPWPYTDDGSPNPDYTIEIAWRSEPLVFRDY